LIAELRADLDAESWSCCSSACDCSGVSLGTDSVIAGRAGEAKRREGETICAEESRTQLIEIHAVMAKEVLRVYAINS
jgi:hypothetical protein